MALSKIFLHHSHPHHGIQTTLNYIITTLTLYIIPIKYIHMLFYTILYTIFINIMLLYIIKNRSFKIRLKTFIPPPRQINSPKLYYGNPRNLYNTYKNTFKRFPTHYIYYITLQNII